jgi:hypothetical protein
LNVWDVVQDDRLIGQDTGGQQFEGGVFIAAGGNFAVEGVAPFNDKFAHKISSVYAAYNQIIKGL